jgi:outer membrane protein TolC
VRPAASPRRLAFLPGAALAAALLAGCAGVTPDHGFGAVADATRARRGAAPRIARDPQGPDLDAEVQALLAQPLDMSGAVRVALLNHPGLQATYWEVGVAQADLAQASRLQNPGFDFKRTGAGGDLEIERTLTFNLVGALLTPLASKLEARRFEQVRHEVADRIEKHALATRRAWVEAVAAAQSMDYARKVDEAAAAGAELAARMAKAGNMSALDLAREQVFHAETSAALARAARQAVEAREQLTRLLGLWGKDAQYTLPDHLPDLPDTPAQLEDIERTALEHRLDVQAARRGLDATAANLGLARATRFVNVFDLAGVNKTASGAPTARGYELNISVPLFDWGGARTAKAEAQYMQAVNRVADAAVTARSEARAGYLGYRASYDVARHYRDTIIPLRKRISDEMLLRYNAMQVGSLDLLADSREQSTAVAAYIETLRDFWNAHAALEALLAIRVAHPGGTGKEHKEHAE